MLTQIIEHYLAILSKVLYVIIAKKYKTLTRHKAVSSTFYNFKIAIKD